MTKPKKIIGFDRVVRLEWLDATAEWVAQGLPTEIVRDKLKQLLDAAASGHMREPAVKKTMTVLLRIWSMAPDNVTALRDEAIGYIHNAEKMDRIILHWGMCMAVYPFFTDVVWQIGRLSLLQDTFSVEQIRRRIIERWGDTERVRRSVRQVVQTLKEWSVLSLTSKTGTYALKPKIIIQDTSLQVWLVMACMLAIGGQMSPFKELVRHPALFPFFLNVSARDLDQHPKLEMFHQGVDESVIALRKAVANGG